MSLARNALDVLLDWLFPRRCLNCRSYVEGGYWCERCLAQISLYRRLYRPPYLDAVILLYRYRSGLQRTLKALKFRRRQWLAVPLRSLLTACEALILAEKVDYVVPVPLSEIKLRRRGFNQTALIFAPWARQRRLEWLDALVRARYTEPQYTLSLAGRRRNLRGAFKLAAGTAGKLDGKTVLLVDDIYTTGTTLEECAKILKKAGVLKVIGVSLCSDV